MTGEVDTEAASQSMHTDSYSEPQAGSWAWQAACLQAWETLYGQAVARLEGPTLRQGTQL